MASDASYNLRGQRKAEALIARFGERRFGYAGNSKHDLEVWEHAGQVIVVNPERGLLDRLGDDADIVFE
jgi:phosphoserine phosphatase